MSKRVPLGDLLGHASLPTYQHHTNFLGLAITKHPKHLTMMKATALREGPDVESFGFAVRKIQPALFDPQLGGCGSLA